MALQEHPFRDKEMHSATNKKLIRFMLPPWPGFRAVRARTASPRCTLDARWLLVYAQSPRNVCAASGSIIANKLCNGFARNISSVTNKCTPQQSNKLTR
jgi:hypothetical protein